MGKNKNCYVSSWQIFRAAPGNQTGIVAFNSTGTTSSYIRITKIHAMLQLHDAANVLQNINVPFFGQINRQDLSMVSPYDIDITVGGVVDNNFLWLCFTPEAPTIDVDVLIGRQEQWYFNASGMNSTMPAGYDDTLFTGFIEFEDSEG